MTIRVAIGQFHELTDEKLRFAAQIGASGIQMNNPTLPGDAYWEERDVRALVDTVQAAGLKFEAVENVPTHFYDKVMTGAEGRDQQIENYQRTIRAVARAGVPILGYHFMPSSVWTTDREAPTRGGAVARKFDMAEVEAVAGDVAAMKRMMPTTLGRQSSMPVFEKGGQVITEGQMWSNYEYFIKAVLPVAEAEGLRLALHPDDPPVPMLGGVARLFYKPENFKRAYDIAGKSRAWALDLCLGCCSEMPGGAANVREMIEYFAPKVPLPTSISATCRAPCPTSQSASLGTGIMIRLRSWACCCRTASTDFSSTTTCRKWTAIATGAIAAAPMPSATCRG
jgi:mannonate dehydratase